MKPASAFCHSACALCLYCLSYLVLSVLCILACQSASIRLSTSRARADHNTSCVFLPANATCLQVIHTACVWFVWERSTQSRLSAYASLAKGSLFGGIFHQHSPQCWSRCRRGGVVSVLVGFAAGSDGGIGDERVSISVLTHQIRWPLPEIGNPPGGYFSSGSSVFLLSSSSEVDVRSLWSWSLVLWPD